MASSQVTVKFSASLQAPVASGSGSRNPDSVSLEFTAKNRIGEQVRRIAASGTLSIVKADEGLGTVNLMKIECLTAGSGFNIAFDGDSNGSDFNPPSTTTKAFFIGTCDFTSAVITNLDSSNPIDVALTFYEKDS